MDNERSAIINIGGDEYELLLTTKATKEIAGRYGGLENLGDKLMKSDYAACQSVHPCPQSEKQGKQKGCPYRGNGGIAHHSRGSGGIQDRYHRGFV